MTSIRQHIKRVLNEEKNSLKNDPVKHYYYNYLNEEPIKFKGIYLVPKWTGERIEWEVDNPNDYSYGKALLNEVLYDEFESFCEMTNTNYLKYRHNSSWMENIPNGCYISKQDRKEIDRHGKQIQQIEFTGEDSRYMFNFDYERTSITCFYSEIAIYVYGNIPNLIQTNLNGGGTYPVNPRHFISDMTDIDYDIWKEELFNILKDIYVVLTQNPRIYDNRMDYLDLGLQQTP
jgi:hypothetical protein